MVRILNAGRYLEAGVRVRVVVTMKTHARATRKYRLRDIDE